MYKAKLFKSLVMMEFCFACFVMFLGSEAQISAQEKDVIELSYASPFGPDHPLSQADQKWITKIESETNGKVRIKPYWGETLVGYRDAVTEIAKGVADIGHISPGYAKAGLFITRASFVFYHGARQEIGRRVFKEILLKFPEIENEYAAVGLKVLAWTSGLDNQLITKKPVRRVEDLKGMRLKTIGEIVEVVKTFGAEATTTPVTELYTSLQKGLLDGTFSALETLKTWKLAEVAKYCTLIHLYRTHCGTRVINLAKWSRLPDEVKKVFEKNIEFWGLQSDKTFMEADKTGYDYGKQQGVQYITLSPDELDKFYQPFVKIAEKEASILDSKGLPGTRIYREVQQLIKTYSKQ